MSQNEKDGKRSNTSDGKNINTNVKKQKTSRPKVGKFSLVFAIIFLLFEIVNIVGYFVIVFNKNNVSGEKSTVLLTFHIIFHSCFTIVDISLFITAFKSFLKIRTSALPWITSGFLIITLVFYVTYIFASMVEIKEPKNQITLDQLQEILKNSAINSTFFYTKSKINTESYSFNPITGVRVPISGEAKCYSNSGILLPVKSKQINDNYNFLNAPKFFYFQIIQDANLSEEFQKQYYHTISQIKSCVNNKIKIKYIPRINKIYIVGNPEMPEFLDSKYKFVACFYGAGFYFEQYTKTIPFISYKQKFNIDIDPTFDYDKLWAKKWCKKYGKCESENPKPEPIFDDL